MTFFNSKELALSEFEYEFQQRDTQPPLMSDLWLRGLRDNFTSEIGLSVSPPEYIFTSRSKGYVSSKSKAAILKELEKAVGDRTYLERVLHNTLSVPQAYEDAARDIAREAYGKNGKELLPLWRQFSEEIMTVVPWFWIPWYLSEGNLLSNRVKEQLEKHTAVLKPLATLDEALGVLIFPTKEVAFQQEQRSLYELVCTAQEKPSFETDPTFALQAKTHLENFGWMTTFLILPIEPLSQPALVGRVKEGLRTDFVREYEVRQKKAEENRELADTILSLCDDKKLTQEVESARALGYGLTAGVDCGLRAGATLLPFYKAVAEALDVPYENWTSLRGEEIALGLEGGDVPNVSQRNIRSSYVAYLKDDIDWLFGAPALEVVNEIERTIDGKLQLKEFKGQIAFRGKVTGKVRVAETPRDAALIEDGEILVTSMTSPDYVPAMKKSGAIVTNEGGLLSHAAIMSREFRKPCIIATKIATRVLKTGDLIEVDAERGVVRVISSKKE